jgi:hypothetical protein
LPPASPPRQGQRGLIGGGDLHGGPHRDDTPVFHGDGPIPYHRPGVVDGHHEFPTDEQIDLLLGPLYSTAAHHGDQESSAKKHHPQDDP